MFLKGPPGGEGGGGIKLICRNPVKSGGVKKKRRPVEKRIGGAKSKETSYKKQVLVGSYIQL